MTTGGMHCTGTGFQRHVVAQDRRHIKIEERVFKTHQFQVRTFHHAQHGKLTDTSAFHHAFQQIFREDQRLPFNLHQRIVKFRGQRDRAVRRQRPRGGGPDNQRDRTVNAGNAKFRFYRVDIDGMERHVDRRRGFVVILNFRFCQRRTAVNAPVHRLGAFMQVTVTDDFTQRTDNVGFGFEVHGAIRMFPIAQYAKTDKVFALAVDLGRSVFTAFCTELRGGEFLTRLTKFLLYFQFDRQTVTVPARHIRRVVTRKAFGLHDNVFQNLVNRVTNMNAAIRIRRAIMQNAGLIYSHSSDSRFRIYHTGI